MKSKSFKILLTLSILVFLSGICQYYKSTGIRVDIFLFYNYSNPNGLKGRLVANIINDISIMITVSSLLWLLVDNVLKSTKRVIYPFFIISLIDLIDYLLFFKQFAVIKLLLLIALILIYNIKPLQKQ